MKKGQSFGELALQGEDYRQATVTANSPGVECLTLTREHFRLYFVQAEGPPKEDLGTSAEEYRNLQLDDLKMVATLGIGAFGRVELVQTCCLWKVPVG